jgi:hypothetical protein
MVTRRGRDDEHPALTGDGSDLARLLADAAAPARTDELAGMSQAVSWFAERPARRRSLVPGVVAALVATKTALAATAASAAVGVVTVAAAATGSLPAPAQDAAHDVFGAPAAKARPAATATATTEASATPKATPSPSLVGLCRAYSAGSKDERGKALESPAFTALLTAAGGESGVEALCTATLASAAPTARPTDAGKPSSAGRPSSAGKPGDAGKPTEPGRPDDAGRPTDAGKPDDAGKPTPLPRATGKPSGS